MPISVSKTFLINTILTFMKQLTGDPILLITQLRYTRPLARRKVNILFTKFENKNTENEVLEKLT